MWESVFLTVVANAGNNIGKILQRKGTLILPPLSFKLKVIRTYASNKAWVIGFPMDILGAFLMLLALSQAPVSVIQPVSGCGLAILSVFSHFYLKETMNAIDCIGIQLAGIGTIEIGVGGEEQKASSISVFHLPWLVFVVVILFMQYEVIEEITHGLESGSLFGSGIFQINASHCISISIFCSTSGFIVQTRGLKHGRAIVVSTCAAVASIVTGVLAGILVLGERLPSAPVARFLLLIGWLFIIIGVILLVTSTRLIRYLPRPRHSFARSGMERNFGTEYRGHKSECCYTSQHVASLTSASLENKSLIIYKKRNAIIMG